MNWDPELDNSVGLKHTEYNENGPTQGGVVLSPYNS